MTPNFRRHILPAFLLLTIIGVLLNGVSSAEKVTGLLGSMSIANSPPWIALEAGLYQKNDLDFQLVYIPSSAISTAALLSGEGEVMMGGAVGIIRAFIQGAADLVSSGSPEGESAKSCTD